MPTYSIQKTQKVTGRRQTWAIYRQRPGVSATVWERVPGAPLEYYRADYARQVAADLFSVNAWQRIQGRGSAYWIGGGLR